MKSLKNDLEKLVKSTAISGYEWSGNITNTIQNLIGFNGEKIGSNLLYILGEGKETIFISAHMDEVGFFITNINKNLATILPIGDIEIKNLKNEILIFNNKTFKLDKNLILNNKKLSIGDVGTFQKKTRWEKEIIISPSLDNKVGCLVIIELIKKLKKLELNKRFIFCFACREEAGTNGVINALKKFSPNLCIDIDSAYAKPLNDIKKTTWCVPSIENGPAIQLMGNGFIIESEYRELIEKVAIKNKIPYQYEIPDSEFGGTNAANILNNGYEVLQINIPVANQHSAKSKASINDVKNTIYLLSKLLIEI